MVLIISFGSLLLSPMMLPSLGMFNLLSASDFVVICVGSCLLSEVCQRFLGRYSP